MAKKQKATAKKPEAGADIGVIGLAVMGENLILNMERNGFTVACYNRTTSKVDEFTNGRAEGKKVVGCHSVKELCRQSQASAQSDVDGQGGASRSTISSSR